MLTHLIRLSVNDTQEAELDNASNDPLMHEVRLLEVAQVPGAGALSVQEEYELGGYAGI